MFGLLTSIYNKYVHGGVLYNICNNMRVRGSIGPDIRYIGFGIAHDLNQRVSPDTTAFQAQEMNENMDKVILNIEFQSPRGKSKYPLLTMHRCSNGTVNVYLSDKTREILGQTSPMPTNLKTEDTLEAHVISLVNELEQALARTPSATSTYSDQSAPARLL